MNKDLKYKAIYKIYQITTGSVIDRNDKSRVQFLNTGTVDAVINNCIPLPAGSDFEFKEHHCVQIETDFDIIFPGTDTGNKIVVIETYYETI